MVLMKIDRHAYVGGVVDQNVFDLHVIIVALCKSNEVLTLGSELSMGLCFRVKFAIAF